MKIGLHLPEVERVVRWGDMRDLCRVAEDVGFDSLWVPDHLLYRDGNGDATGPWECWSVLSAVAATTSRVEIGPLVLCTSFREPGLIAKMASTVDEISDGRLILGLGAGWNRTEYEAFGFPYESRFGRFREAFEIIATLLREGHIDYQGRYYTLRDCELRPSGPRAGGPPLLIGSRGGKVLRQTLPHVVYWNGWARWWGNDVNRIGPLLAEVDKVAREIGRDPGEIQKTAAIFVRLEGGVDPDNPEAPHLEGSDEVITEALHAYGRMGIRHLQIVLDPITPDGVERFGKVLEGVRSVPSPPAPLPHGRGESLG
jgi:alkanesulfonate monooxygenase SsuD/methylene tetrahydromethanopterin reductase-like flavin-dependent oxidoreductase (luciferase family)